MKMITAIINRNDSGEVCRELSKNKIIFTKIATSGGFLRAGNTTLLIGTQDDEVDAVLKIIHDHSRRRTEQVMEPMFVTDGIPIMNPRLIDVEVGGATVFVTDVCRFEKM